MNWGAKGDRGFNESSLRAYGALRAERGMRISERDLAIGKGRGGGDSLKRSVLAMVRELPLQISSNARLRRFR